MRTEIKAALVLGLFGILGAVIWGINSGRKSRVELPLDVSATDLASSSDATLTAGFEKFGGDDFTSSTTSPPAGDDPPSTPLSTPLVSEPRSAAGAADQAADDPIDSHVGVSSDSTLPPRVDPDQPLATNNETLALDDSDAAANLAARDEITNDPPVETLVQPQATVDQPLDPEPGGNTRLSALNTSPSTDTTYTIQDGDTFISIARQRYGHDKYAKAIQAANPDLEATRLRVDHPIKLPSAVQIAALDHKSSAPANEAKPAELGAIKQERGMYIVEPGDTLTAIARKLLEDGSRWDEIYELNRDKLSSPDRIVDGIELRIPKRAPQKTG